MTRKKYMILQVFAIERSNLALVIHGLLYIVRLPITNAPFPVRC
jgi:hypothetical protein